MIPCLRKWQPVDREELALRNRAMTEAFHTIPFKHKVRRRLLRMIADIPFAPIPRPANERILLIRPDHVGDMLLATPAFYALRAARPRSELHALVGPWSAEVLANYGELDRVLTLPFPGFSRKPSENLGSPYQQAVTASRLLRRIGYTSAVIMRPDHWWGAMLVHLAGIPIIIGYEHPDVLPFLTDKLPFDSDHKEHAVVMNLRLVERWTGRLPLERARYRFPVEQADRAYIDGYLEEWGIKPESPLICIHPGSGTWVKRWDDERWAQVADTLAEQLNAEVVFTGGDHERPLVSRIAELMRNRACLMAGDTRIGQMAALYARAKVVLGPDSGPLHLAAAVGTPTVTLFGPADPVEFGTWGAAHKHIILTTDIPCRPCGILDWGTDDPSNHPCVRDITVGRVLEAARRAAHHAPMVQ